MHWVRGRRKIKLNFLGATEAEVLADYFLEKGADYTPSETTPPAGIFLVLLPDPDASMQLLYTSIQS
jgi:hypothetical protein